MKIIKTSISIALLTLVSQSVFADVTSLIDDNEYNLSVEFDNFTISNDDKLIFSLGTVQSDILSTSELDEEEDIVFNNLIEEQVVKAVCSVDKHKELMRKEKYLTEVEIMLDSGEEYMLISMESCEEK